MDRVDIYINQTHKSPRKTNGAWQYLITMMTAKGPADTKGFGVAEATAHEAELIALDEALRRFTAPCILYIHSEHGYFEQIHKNGWLAKWKENNYMNSKGIPVIHEERLRAIEELLQNHEVGEVDNCLGEYTQWMQTQIDQNYRNYRKGALEHVKRFWRI